MLARQSLRVTSKCREAELGANRFVVVKDSQECSGCIRQWDLAPAVAETPYLPGRVRLGVNTGFWCAVG